MSFHFTQICAFLTYSFRFMGYCLCFIVAKLQNFPKNQAAILFFSVKIGVLLKYFLSFIYNKLYSIGFFIS